MKIANLEKENQQRRAQEERPADQQKRIARQIAKSRAREIRSLAALAGDRLTGIILLPY